MFHFSWVKGPFFSHWKMLYCLIKLMIERLSSQTPEVISLHFLLVPAVDDLLQCFHTRKSCWRHRTWHLTLSLSCASPGPRLMMDIQHSTLNVFEWGIPGCGVWILSVECWLSIISLGSGPKLMTITQHSTLKTPDLASCIWMGNLECGRIHIPFFYHFPILLVNWIQEGHRYTKSNISSHFKMLL